MGSADFLARFVRHVFSAIVIGFVGLAGFVVDFILCPVTSISGGDAILFIATI